MELEERKVKWKLPHILKKKSGREKKKEEQVEDDAAQ